MLMLSACIVCLFSIIPRCNQLCASIAALRAAITRLYRFPYIVCIETKTQIIAQPKFVSFLTVYLLISTLVLKKAPLVCLKRAKLFAYDSIGGQQNGGTLGAEFRRQK